ncbi:hypothetical protein FQR65_LT06317 [Abscondita terminalis]|nr:hypothetical protein FQR65_LT06317 [Abscondita terminalis]
MGFKFNIEVPALLIFFALNFSSTITGNYVIYATCYVTLGHNQSTCALLGTNNTTNETDQLEKEVQPFATRVTVTSSVIDTIFGPLMCFFLGSWSDKYGRKPVMLIAIAGFAGSHLIKCVLTAIPFVSPWLIILASVPTGITGGLAASIAAFLCYVTDTTTNNERGMKLFLFEGVLGVGMVLSSLTCTLAFKAFGYPPVFLIAFLCTVLAWVFVYFCLQESVKDVQRENRMKNLFNFELLRSTIKTVLKPRPHYGRGIILATFVILGLGIFALLGLGSVTYLYLRNRFAWSLEDCTYFTSVMTVIGILGGVLALIICYKVLKLTEVSILLLSFIVCTLSYIFQGLARNWLEIYIAKSFDFLSATISPMVRTLMSKIVDSEDIGKIFSILITVELVFGLLGSLFYTFVYNVTLTTLPSAFYFVTAGIYVIDIIMLGVIMLFKRYSTLLVYEDLTNETIN